MAEKFFPFDSVNNDRLYSAEDFASCFALFIGNGIFPNPSSNLQVIANNTMNVTVKKGSGFINGRMYVSDSDLIFKVPPPHSTYIRRDCVVLKLDMVNRNISVKYNQGVASSNPQFPTPVKNSDVWELVLAQINVKANSNQITQSDINDTRLNSNLCGIVSNIVNKVDTTTIFNQYRDYWERQREENQNLWQEQMREQEEGYGAEKEVWGRRYNELKTSVENWFDSIKHNISALKGFDLDNFFDLQNFNIEEYKNGNKWHTKFTATGSSFARFEIIQTKVSSVRFITEIKEYSALQGAPRAIKTITITEYKSGNKWIREVR